MRQKEITIIGAGLAGSEAAYQIAKRGIQVKLYEMRPEKMTEAHTTSHFAELVCSNSFGSDSPNSASKILKNEVEAMDSLILKCARKHAVPAGASLAVDRVKLALEVTETLQNNPNIKIFHEEIKDIPKDEIVILATGPLTSKPLCESLCREVGVDSLYFYDAISPIVSFDSLNLDKMYFANRYDKGDTADFLNIALDKNQYEELVKDLLTGEVVLPHDFEKEKYFESCMPIEAIAARGPMTLAFGPMKPVGLNDPKTGKRPFAVIQLRTENSFKTAYNLVGFQTKLKYKEQERVFRKLPGLEEVEFLRLGSMHRNTYLNSPKLLQPSLQLKNGSSVFIAGQLTGTEGYLESVATGLLAGINSVQYLLERTPIILPKETMLGALIAYITDPTRENFQPTNSNMGLFPPLETVIKKDKAKRNEAYAFRSDESISRFKSSSLFDSI